MTKTVQFLSFACFVVPLGFAEVACIQPVVDDGEAASEGQMEIGYESSVTSVSSSVSVTSSSSSGGGEVCDAPCGNGKVAICHIPPGNPGNAHDICVGAPAVPAHLAHGDTCGPCAPSCKPYGAYCGYASECRSNVCYQHYCSN